MTDKENKRTTLTLGKRTSSTLNFLCNNSEDGIKYSEIPSYLRELIKSINGEEIDIEEIRSI